MTICKNLILLIIIITSISCSINSEKSIKTDLYYEGLKGSVKSYTEIEYLVKSDSLERSRPNRELDEFVVFNKSGFKVKSFSYRLNRHYEDYGKDLDSIGKPQKWDSFVIRKTDTTLRYREIEDEDTLSLVRYFDKHHKLYGIETQFKSPTGELKKVSKVYLINDSTSDTSWTIYNQEDLSILRIQPPFNTDSTYLKLNTDGEVMYWTNLKNGKQVGPKTEYEYKYDLKGNWTEMKVNVDGKSKQVFKRVYEYF